MGQPLQAAALPSSRLRASAVERWFFVGVAVMMILLNLIAFTPSLVDPSARNQPLPLPPLVVIHTAVSIAWLLLFLAQTTLAATGRLAAHRRVGVYGGALSLFLVVLATMAVVTQARRGFDLSGDIGRLPLPSGVDGLSASVALLYFPVQFALLIGAALWYRNRPAQHKRLMLFAVLGGLTPTPVAHIMGHWIGPQPWATILFPVTALFFMAPIAVYDRLKTGRVQPVTLWLIGAIVASDQVFTWVIQRTQAWHGFAEWVVR